MKLREFINKYVDSGSSIKLLTKIKVSDDWEAYTCVENNCDKLYDKHQLQNTEYIDWELVGVRSGSILKEHGNPINIVLVDPSPYRNFMTAIKLDKEMFKTYKDNIAMAFKDNYDNNVGLNENANIGAEAFLRQLIDPVY